MKKESKTSMPKTRKFYPVAVNLTRLQVQSIDEIARIENKKRLGVIRDALDYYLLKYGQRQLDAQQSELSQDMQRLEQRFSSLVVKLLRIAGENQYWITLPWFAGPPKGRLNQDGVQHHAKRARAYSAMLMRMKRYPQQTEEAVSAERDATSTENSNLKDRGSL